jgi:cyclic pyranopterin phosphate synthase
LKSLITLDQNSTPAKPAPSLVQGEARLIDSFGRAITDLRVAITDRCNYRCVYCRSGESSLPHHELTIAEYSRLIGIFVSLGIEKVRLTGGEPLLRRGVVDLVREVAISGAHDVALTTNGHLLAAMAAPLKQAGLNRVTVSLDAVEPEKFAAITRVQDGFERVLAGIRAAQDAGLTPVKVNCVLLRGFNDDQIEAFGEFARTEDVILRFIEFMPLEEATAEGTGRVWSPESVVRMDEIIERLERVRPLVALPPNAASETARRFTFADGRGEIGIIAPVSRPFCGHCSRIRLTADGHVRTCLFSQTDHDLAGMMRRGAADDDLRMRIRSIVEHKEARHHIGEPGFVKPARSMVQIGG